MSYANRRDFSSLSVKDLLDAREAYHVHLAHLDRVYATAIGRYLIRADDRNAHDPGHHTSSRELGPRTLANSDVKSWSWPCVLVFVRSWFTPGDLQSNPALASELVPSSLYLPDGRVVPTCVVEVDPDLATPGAVDMPVFKSDLVGGGYPVLTMVQGKPHLASIGCLVTDGRAVYGLTNNHVVGEPGQEIFAGFKNTDRRLGISDRRQLGKRPFRDVYPGWPGERVVANLDAGLIRIDDVKSWTAQVYGVGQIGDVWDLNVDSFQLDIIGCPLIAFGAVSGPMKGRILGLFYRYKTVGGVEYVTDLLIGPRDDTGRLNNYPGDSGTIWFEDDPDAPRNANGARILRPVALEWGGQTMLAPGHRASTQLALGICLSTICRELDVELIPDWNVGHTEYWGEWGHVKIGAYATSQISDEFGTLARIMQANAGNIGLDDRLLVNMKPHQAHTFSPLADVADLVWRFTRKSDENNHFADMDKPGKDGRTLLDLCAGSPDNVDPKVWNDYYEGIGEDRRGALPFRVWQIFDEMVGYLQQDKLLEFVCAAGIVAHYVGDACQPLHISQYHHGLDPSDKTHAKVHSVYETTMVTRHGRELLTMIPEAVTEPVSPLAGTRPTGHAAAVAVVALMQRTVKRLPPMTIVKLFDDDMGRGQVAAMWEALKEPTAACMQDGAKTLARLWEAAWRAAGNGSAHPDAVAYAQDDLERLYNTPSFLPAYPLQELTVDAKGHLVSRGSVPGATRRAPKASTGRSAPARGGQRAGHAGRGRGRAHPG